MLGNFYTMTGYDIYDNREKWKVIFVFIAFSIALLSIFISNHFVKLLSKEEYNKMEVWAEATRQLAVASESEDQTLVLSVLQSNKTIPVIVVDDSMTILWHANIKLPGDVSEESLLAKLEDFKRTDNLITIDLGDGQHQYLYYDESVILKLLGFYPYILLLIISLFAILVYFVLNTTKKSEQNRVWVGLSKETAHQLGTPISSLMAWIELLKSMDNIDQTLIQDMDKDVVRLQTIAERFSKIGSRPKPEPFDLNEELTLALAYMKKRISSKIELKEEFGTLPHLVLLNTSLFAWVVENLCKNAIDAMEGKGTITVRTSMKNENWAIVDITDTGKGILKSKYKTIFRPGYTSKKRGWGLGLTLVKRIVEEYHGGKIYVKESILNVGTTFRIELRAFIAE